MIIFTRMPWAQPVWALPVVTTIAPSERYYHARGRKPKSLTERAKQMIMQLRRWLPNRQLVIVGDSSYAALDLLAACQALTRPYHGELSLANGCRLVRTGSALSRQGAPTSERRSTARAIASKVLIGNNRVRQARR